MRGVAVMVALLASLGGCDAAQRYAPCDATRECPAAQRCWYLTPTRSVCLDVCGPNGVVCAPDELCVWNGEADWVCAIHPPGSLGEGAICRLDGEPCATGLYCTATRGFHMPYTCRRLCGHADHQPAPELDARCAAGEICASSLVQLYELVCVVPCVASDPFDCPYDGSGRVCAAGDCLFAFEAARCADGSICADGLICDDAGSAPADCLDPITYDARHPRPVTR